MIQWEKKLQNPLFLQRQRGPGNQQQKSERRNWHLFRHTICNTFTNVFLQHFLKMMSNFVENVGYATACFTKILGFASKSFKMVKLFSRIDLLFSDNQHFAFWKTAFSELDFKGFTVCVVYRTPKFRRKIQDSEKSVDMVLTKMELGVCGSILQLFHVL